MADGIKVIKADDLLQGVKLTFHGQAPGDGSGVIPNSKAGGTTSPEKAEGGPAAAKGSISAIDVAQPAVGAHATPDSPSVPPLSSLLEGIAASLNEQYQASEWLVPPGQPNDWRFMLTVCRAALVAWFNPVSTLSDRLSLTEAVGRAFGLDEHALEQVVAESLVINAQVPQQLALQHTALSANTFAVGLRSFSTEQEGRLAYQEFRREAMVEAEHLLQQQLGFPEFNGMLQVEVVGATGLKVSRTKGSTKRLLPYAVVWLSDKGGSRRGEKLFTQTASDLEAPVWIQQLPPMTVANADTELVVQVRCAQDRSRPSRADMLLGRVAVRLSGLPPGLTQQLDLHLYGQGEAAKKGRGGREVSGGGGRMCGCFSGGSVKDHDSGVSARTASSTDQLDDGDGSKLVFDPTTSLTTGARNLREAGLLTLMLRYLPERRERVRLLAEPPAPGPAGPHISAPSSISNARHQRTSSACDPEQCSEGIQPGANQPASKNGNVYDDAVSGSVAGLPGLAGLLQAQLEALHSPATSSVRRVRRLDSRKVDPVAVIDPGADFHITFRKLAAALQALAADQLGGAAALSAVPDSGIPLTALGALGQFLEDSGLEGPLQRFLPRALGPTGLPLLLIFAKLFRVRTATQQVALLLALLGEGAWDPGSFGYLQLVKQLWEPVLLWNSGGRLTCVETEGLTGVNATFLRRACPLLANHYDVLPGEEAVPCLVLLVEMVGWAVTGDPRRRTSGTPEAGAAAASVPSAASLHLLIDHMQRAAIAAADVISAMRPTHDSLPADVAALTCAAQRVMEQLEQDLRLQVEIPGFRSLTRTNCRVRYDALADALETLFMYRPGSSKAASTALWPLEVAVTGLHNLMMMNHLARQPHIGSSPTRRRRRTEASASTAATSPSQPSGTRNTNGDGYGSDESDVSPVSLESKRGNASRPPRRSPGGGDGRRGTWTSGGDGGGGGGKRGRADADEDEDTSDHSGGGEPLAVLFDFEAAMAEAMAEWAELGGEDLKRQLVRLLERDPIWPPPPPPQAQTPAHGAQGGNGTNGGSLSTTRPQGTDPRTGLPSQTTGGGAGGGACRVGKALVGKALLSSGAGESAVELFRMLQVYLDLSVERALAGGEQRPALMGPAICASVVSCVRIYLHHCMRSWDEVVLLRAPPTDTATAAAADARRHARTLSDRLLNAIGVTGPAVAATPTQVAASVAAAAAGGSLHGSFAANGTGPSQVQPPQLNHGALSGLVAGIKPQPAPAMPEYGVMPAVAPTAAAVAAALSAVMAAGPGPSAAAAAAAGSSHMVGGASLQTPTQQQTPKRGHRRAATATDGDVLAGSNLGLTPTANVANGGPTASTPNAAILATIPSSTALALASEPGFVACGPLVLIRNTIAAVAEGAEALEETLGLLAPRAPLIVGKASAASAAAAASASVVQTPGGARRMPVESAKSQQLKATPAVTATAAAPPPAFLTRVTSELHHALTLASEQCINSYHLALRSSILRGLVAAFDPDGARPPSRTALESVLSALHDELLHVAGGVRQVAVASSMVHSAWEAAVRCVWSLALNQAAFRAITEEEADVLREFLISLQDMFGEIISEHLNPKVKAAANAAAAAAAVAASASAVGKPNTSGGAASATAAPLSALPAVLLTADSRAAGTAYPSALLQCVAASTQDLMDMYSAQISCLQKLDGPCADEDAPGTGASGHQVSLLDLLRLLRQRRRTDPMAQTFVIEQLRLAASNATQVLFGLRASERLVATASCYLAPPVGATGLSTGGTGLSLPLGPVGSTGWGRDGCLYVTSRVLGFSTMLVGDLRGVTDITSYIRLKAIREVARGEAIDNLLVLTHGGDLYQFFGLSTGDRDRLIGLINGRPAIARIPHMPGTQAGGGGASHQNSPSRSTGGHTPSTGAGSGGGSITPPGAMTPKGLPKPPSQPSNLASALLSAFTSPSAASSTPAAVAAAAVNITGGGGSCAHTNLSSKLGKAAAVANMEAVAAAGGVASAAGVPTSTVIAPPDSGSLPLFSAPCHLVNVLRNKEGLLNLYASRLDFVCSTDPAVSRSMPLAHINNVSQKPAGWVGGSVLVLSLEGDKAPVVFGGIGDALLATLKQTISELCFSNG